MPLSVLVIEDQAELREMVALLLVRAGYTVECTASADEAVARLQVMQRPCLILWDPVTPHMSPAFLAQPALRGIHVATIPVGVQSIADGSGNCLSITKRLTSQNAIMTMVREFCATRLP